MGTTADESATDFDELERMISIADPNEIESLLRELEAEGLDTAPEHGASAP